MLLHQLAQATTDDGGVQINLGIIVGALVLIGVILWAIRRRT